MVYWCTQVTLHGVIVKLGRVVAIMKEQLATMTGFTVYVHTRTT